MKKLREFIKGIIGFILGIIIFCVNITIAVCGMVIEGYKIIISFLMIPYILVYACIKKTYESCKKK